MRKLVYVSESKLQQLGGSETRRRSVFRRIREVGLKAPLDMGELSVGLNEAKSSTRSRLAEAVSRLESSDYLIRWYADTPELTAGEWVVFEARMNFGVFEQPATSASSQSALFFWETSVLAESPSVRLLLHGSADNFVGKDAISSDFGTSVGFSLPARFFSYIQAGQSRPSTSAGIHAFSSDVEDLISVLEAGQPAGSASWMAGHARITFVAQGRGEPTAQRDGLRYVVASPLYVERVPPPRGMQED